MPFALVFLAVALIVSGFRGTQNTLFCLLKQDAGGQFLLWAGAVGVVGAVGYIKPLEAISNAMLTLLIVVLFLGHGGVFAQAASALKTSASSAGTGNVVQPATSNVAPNFSALQTGQNLLSQSGIGGIPQTPLSVQYGF